MLHLKSRNGRRGEELYVDMKGSTKAVELALCILEKCLLRLIHHADHGRALYYLALLNDHRLTTERNGLEIVHQYCYHRSKKEKGIKRHMVYKRLSEDADNFIGKAIGKNGWRKKEIVADTNCDIDIHGPRHGVRHHYVIYGDSVESVVMCAKQLQSSIDEAEEFFKRRTSSQRR